MSPSQRSSLRKSLSSGRRIAVLAVGSTLRADDAAGLLTAEELRQILETAAQAGSHPSQTVEIFIAETAPENFTGQIKAFAPDRLVLLDAVDCGLGPGETRLLRRDELSTVSAPSTHNASLGLMLDYLGHFLQAEVVILGIQPATLQFGLSASPEVRTAAHDLAVLLASCLGSV
jgi:hydrogenase 3 maturation protease